MYKLSGLKRKEVNEKQKSNQERKKGKKPFSALLCCFFLQESWAVCFPGVRVQSERLEEQEVKVSARGDLIGIEQRVEEEHSAVLQNELIGIRCAQPLHKQTESARGPLKLDDVIVSHDGVIRSKSLTLL